VADKVRYPQIPATVWWGVRSVLNKSPRARIDEKLLGAQLGVQDTAAKQYVAELKAVGMLDDECRATDLANKWRLDETYAAAVKELVEKNYPEGLRHLSPPDEPDRDRVVSWFKREGFGQGAALNKAATYLLLGASEPDISPGKSVKKDSPAKKVAQRAGKTDISKAQGTNGAVVKRRPKEAEANRGGGAAIPLNVNVQIHISADATSDQIESIFAAMKRYLYESDEVA
jgi:hypothetical protein